MAEDTVAMLKEKMLSLSVPGLDRVLHWMTSGVFCIPLHPLLPEVANDDVLGFVDRGSYSTLTCFPERIKE